MSTRRTSQGRSKSKSKSTRRRMNWERGSIIGAASLASPRDRGTSFCYDDMLEELSRASQACAATSSTRAGRERRSHLQDEDLEASVTFRIDVGESSCGVGRRVRIASSPRSLPPPPLPEVVEEEHSASWFAPISERLSGISTTAIRGWAHLGSMAGTSSGTCDDTRDSTLDGDGGAVACSAPAKLVSEERRESVLMPLPTLARRSHLGSADGGDDGNSTEREAPPSSRRRLKSSERRAGGGSVAQWHAQCATPTVTI